MSLTITEFVGVLRQIAVLKMEEHAGLKKAAETVQEEAKRVLGTYEYGWAPLAESTIASKDKGDSPGLETEEMKESVKFAFKGASVEVGSDEDKALWFELGTSKGQPPRSWLKEAAVRKSEEVVKEIGYEIIFDLQTIYRLNSR